MSEVSPMISQTQIVFSETIPKPRTVLKVVEIDQLKKEKHPLEIKITGGSTREPLQDLGFISVDTPTASSSCLEGYLKAEPFCEESIMDRNTDCEFFQDLGLWCSDLAKDEPQPIIESSKPSVIVHSTDTPHTQYLPTPWELFDVNSPSVSASSCNAAQTLSGTSDHDNAFVFPDLSGNKSEVHDQFLDLCSLPVVIGDLAGEVIPTAEEAVVWSDIHETHNTKHIHTPKKPFIQDEDSLDMKLGCMESTEVSWSDMIIGSAEPLLKKASIGLKLDTDVATSWSSEPLAISTPEVLSYVVQLEKEDQRNFIDPNMQWPTPEEYTFVNTESPVATTSTFLDSAPVTPNFETPAESEEDAAPKPKRRRRGSEDSDESYTPYASPRKYKRRKQNIPIKDMILALEEATPQVRAPRGRPPKRRDSNVSSTCSAEFSSEAKYREIRDKNNEASKRSRMTRKLKELQFEQLAIELEERNKKLKVRAEILEDMTKKLKDALMTAILKS